ncbi:PREDICTED: WD and tetratricopeptide repeats protein 1-like isoform X1 [Acropora digitifera]|uniref:WD and tetratricopeptide repeats protein 1-like isoform X1 n=1 Tax=Acropora digitifera TaxID=70779 RepID=UPI00077B0494|nr:PREDICTED: WD and tetratricopeptide repeats protein 1-like isoform X1 [Acropora digitifera]
MEARNIAMQIRKREMKTNITRSFQRRYHVHPPFIERFGLETELEGHTGCVNCLEWNEAGNLLVSGSDDLNAIVWDPLQCRTKCCIKTGHTGNIFSVKFLPRLGDRIIATAAADAKVQIHTVETKETSQVYKCHIGRVKRLATAPNTPYLLWSASEDGTIRQFDLRQPHTCNTSSKNCKNVLINLNIYVGAMAEAKCLAINPLQPELLAVGCNDPFVRLYDHRMLSSHSFSEVKKSSATSSVEDAKLPHGCVQYFTPGHLPPQLSKDLRRRFRTYVATYVNFSPCGRELIANLGGEQIYLFDIKTRRNVLKYQVLNGTSVSVSSNGVVKSVVDNSLDMAACKNGWSTSTNGATNGYKIPTLNGKRIVPDEKSKMFGHGNSCCALEGLPPKALELKAKGNEAFCQQKFWKAINLYNEAILLAVDSAVLYANRAAAYIKRAWDGDVYAALRDCHKALRLDPNHTKAHFRQARCLYELQWFQEALTCLNHFKLKFPDQAEGNAAKTLERDIRAAAFAETEESLSCKEDNESNGLQPDSTPSRRRRRLSIVSDQEKDFRTEALDYEQRFCGHCNTTTDIKEANFFGSNGQYIVAGSDDGSFFMWDKQTTNLVKVLKGDESIVNCLQPHPSMCLLATSGIDPVVRLWSPSPVEGNGQYRHIDEVEAAAKANQRRMNADPLEVMLMNMGYRTRFNMSEGSDEDDSGETPIQCRAS